MLLVFFVPLVTPTNACHSSIQPQCVSNDAIRNISSFCQLRLQITTSASHVDSVTGDTMPDTRIYNVLNTTLKEKDLGLTISVDMKVSEQCGIAAAKANQILGLITRNIVYKVKELIIPLYKTIVRPHLE